MAETNDSRASEHPLTDAQLAPYDNSEAYAEAVEPVLERYKRGVDVRQMPGYLGSGSDKHAFRAETSQGPVVVKIARASAPVDEYYYYSTGMSSETETVFVEEMQRRTRMAATPLVKGIGVSNLEQPLSVDAQRGVLVTTFVEGKSVCDMSLAQLLRIDRSHLQQLSITLAEMRRLGLHPHNAENVIFNSKTGFNFVDYELADGSAWPVRNRGDITSIETYLPYLLTNFRRQSARMRYGKMRAEEFPGDAYNVGMRSLALARLMKLVRQI